MSNTTGLLYIASFIILEIGLFFLQRVMKSQTNRKKAVVFIMVSLPAVLLTVINTWYWPASFPPSAMPYSWFHFLFIGLTFIVGFAAIRLGRLYRPNGESHGHLTKADQVVFRFGVFLFCIELYKQIFLGKLFGAYQWYVFPFQFCSVPIYVCLIAPWLKQSRFKEACYSFLGIYAFIAGVGVMALPNSVFISQISICIHTMLWHTGMICIGIFLLTNRRIGTEIRQWLDASLILSGFIVISIGINFIVHYAFPDQWLNAFFLNPWLASPFPVLGPILVAGQAAYGLVWGWLMYLVAYIIAFFLGGFIVYLGSGFFFRTRRVRTTIPAQ
ncbi:MAG: YwaF family protein [Firmicutes bacterium]|nr:YwaF family protein [Bacillota bacterium]